MADGKRRMSGGKTNSRGTPQGGVVSPLLAKLYMNRFLKHWRLTGRGEAFHAHVVAYADDFVILSRGRAAGGAGVDEGGDDQARAHAQRGEDLGEGRPGGTLRLPRLHVRPRHRPRTAACTWGRVPRRRACSGSRRRSGNADAGQQGAWDEVRHELNSLLRGWSAYSGYGTLARRIGPSINTSITCADFLARRHKVQDRGARPVFP